MGWDGIGTLLGKVSTFIPGRVEQMKNERKRLINEQKQLMQVRPITDILRARSIAIDERVSQIDSILGNKATD
jgi:ribosome biogenesis GTPase A